jgi:hypothetical protein
MYPWPAVGVFLMIITSIIAAVMVFGISAIIRRGRLPVHLSPLITQPVPAPLEKILSRTKLAPVVIIPVFRPMVTLFTRIPWRLITIKFVLVNIAVVIPPRKAAIIAIISAEPIFTFVRPFFFVIMVRTPGIKMGPVGMTFPALVSVICHWISKLISALSKKIGCHK